jgi:L-alanine-DL-glutamate epimerase-like enolase superfamily enzyme
VPGAVAAVVHDVAAPVLLGADPVDIERHWHALFHITTYFGYAGAEMRAVSAIDIALWDIVGQATGQPIYNLLGGRVRDRIRTHNTCASYGGISEGKKIAAMAEAYHRPIAPHDCTGPVNVFACLHLCASCPNAMLMESVRAFYRGYYDELVETTLEVREGHIHFPTAPGLGTRLRPSVRERADATVQASSLA